MLLVRSVSGFDGCIRVGKRRIEAEACGDRWEVEVDDQDFIVSAMNAGFVREDSPMAVPKEKRPAPTPSVDVVVVEKAAKPVEKPIEKAAKPVEKPKAPAKKTAPKKTKK